MKINPKKAALIGLASSTVFTLSGCELFDTPDLYGPPTDIRVDQNVQEKVYGPPEMIDEQEKANEAPTIDPAENDVECVYGPPEDFQ